MRNTDEIKLISREVRMKTIELVYKAQAPHIGSALSCIEILVSVFLSVDTEKIREKANDRDRIILSKGHGIAALLATLWKFDILKGDLSDFSQNGSKYLESTSPWMPYIEFATGSLGEGLSLGVGVGKAFINKKYTNSRVFVIVGDGELNEGSNWEALMLMQQLNLTNITLLIDYNNLSGIGNTNESCSLGDIEGKFKAFGLDVITVDGHKEEEIIELINLKEKKKPLAIICKTVKGKGLSFMENENVWHYRPISDDIYLKAIEEMNGTRSS